MTLQPLGLLLTAALVITVRLFDSWSHRRRVRARLRALIDRDNVAVENRLYRRGNEKPREARPNRGSERIVAAR